MNNRKGWYPGLIKHWIRRNEGPIAWLVIIAAVYAIVAIETAGGLTALVSG